VPWSHGQCHHVEFRWTFYDCCWWWGQHLLRLRRNGVRSTLSVFIAISRSNAPCGFFSHLNTTYIYGVLTMPMNRPQRRRIRRRRRLDKMVLAAAGAGVCYAVAAVHTVPMASAATPPWTRSNQTVVDALGSAAPTDVVSKLEALLEADAQLKAAVLVTLAEVSADQWGSRGRDIPGLLEFFEEWANAQAIPSNDSLVIAARHVHDVTQPLGARDKDANTGNESTGLAANTPTPLSFTFPAWSLASESTSSVWLRDPQLIGWLESFVQVRGEFMDSNASWTPDVEQAWWAVVNQSEYYVPPEGFSTFNEFFTREVRREFRPVDTAADTVVAPSDGYCWVQSDNVRPGSDFNLKADNLAPEQLIGFNANFTSRFTNGGTAVINFLSATDYHHFWSPVDGTVLAVEQLGGLYIANGDPCCVGDHRRAYVVLQTEAFGTVAMSAVGMYDISSIVWNATNAKVGATVSKVRMTACAVFATFYFSRGRACVVCWARLKIAVVLARFRAMSWVFSSTAGAKLLHYSNRAFLKQTPTSSKVGRDWPVRGTGSPSSVNRVDRNAENGLCTALVRAAMLEQSYFVKNYYFYHRRSL